MKSKLLRFVALTAVLATMAAPVSARPTNTPLDVGAKPAQDAPELEPVTDVVASTPLGVVRGETKGATDPAIYLIRLTDAPLASYRGGLEGLEATNPAARGERKLDADSAASQAYLQYLRGKQAQFMERVEATLARPVEVVYRYLAANNGMAMRLTPDEAARVAALPEVVYVQKDYEQELHTDNGPAWIGAPGIWSGSATGGVGTMGEGIIVGVIDTGINPLNPSFADVGGDGYDHTNPWGAGTYVGVCDPGNPDYDPSFPCNDKLIGAWGFPTVNGGDPTDYDGHGSHTASTAAGNVVMTATVEAPTLTITRTISGVAPHANIVAYAACCTTSALTAAVDQVVVDGVDVVNYSIGSVGCTASNPWSDFDTVGFLNARDAGIFVATSAGNCGPGFNTVGSPADVPWLTSVGATTHDRAFLNSVISMSGGNTAPPPNIHGRGLTVGYGPEKIVYAGDFPNPNDPGGDPAQCLEPYPAGTFSGEIVVCDRGSIARVAKGANVLAGGAGGLVLANLPANGFGPGSLNGDSHVLPAVHITAEDGAVLKAWLADGGTDHSATIAGVTMAEDAQYADIVAAFSSRGGNKALADILVPSVAAPGVDIIAAEGQNGAIEWNVISGTSMASPHTAGAGALMMSLHPDWTPAEIQSALMTTAWTDTLLKEDGVTPADPFDIGSGRLALESAARAGLVLNETTTNYENADPSMGGDPKTLNLASFGNGNCVSECSWTREVKSTLDATSSWEATVEATPGMTLTVTPASFSLAPGATQVFTVTADVSGLPEDEWAFAEIQLTETTDVPEASIDLAKTVGTDPGACATTDMLSVAAGTTVYYCYEVTNTGEITLPLHDLMDSELGSVLSGFAFDLAPGASVDSVAAGLTVSATIDATTVNTATWTAYDGETFFAQATDSAKVTVGVEDPFTTYYLPIIAGGTDQPTPSTAEAISGIGLAPEAHLPVAVRPTRGNLPGLVEIDTRRDAGSRLIEDVEAIEITDLTIDAFGLAVGQAMTVTLSQDPTNDDPYDDLGDVFVMTTTVPADGKRLVAETTGSEASDIDLFIGSGDTPSAGTELCASTTPTAIEYCDLLEPAPGVYWILVQNWEESGSPPDDTTLMTAVVDGDAMNLSVEGPSSVPAGTPFDLRVVWDEPAMEAGQIWYGAFDVGSAPGSPGDVGTVEVDVHRLEDDVAKIVDDDTPSTGQTLTYTITIQPNVTPVDLTYHLTDTIPSGLTYVPASASASQGTVDVTGDTLTYTGTLASPVGAAGSYEITTSATDASCDTGFGGYVNLEDFGIMTQSGIVGDTVAFTAFTTGDPINFLGTNYSGMSFVDDGFTLFDFDNNYGGQPWVPQFVPNAAQPNNLAAILWQDYEIFYDAALNHGVSLATNGAPGGQIIVEYDDIQFFGGSADTFDFEVVVSRAIDDTPGVYEIVYAYDNLNGDLSGPATIGWEDAAGANAGALVNAGDASSEISDGFMVCLNYVGPSFDPVTITYDVTVDGGASGTLTNNVVHITDDPAAEAVSTSVDVTVSGGH